MKLYRFYRLDRQGQPLGRVEDIHCVSDLQARLKGRQILALEETVPVLDIWDGDHRIVQLTQAGATGSAPRHVSSTSAPPAPSLRSLADLQGARLDADDP
jgi:hypothetical protein